MPRKPPTKGPVERTTLKARVDGDPVSEIVTIETSGRTANWELTSEDGAKRTVYGTVSLVEGDLRTQLLKGGFEGDAFYMLNTGTDIFDGDELIIDGDVWTCGSVSEMPTTGPDGVTERWVTGFFDRRVAS